jgi:hypothetical protein
MKKRLSLTFAIAALAFAVGCDNGDGDVDAGMGDQDANVTRPDRNIQPPPAPMCTRPAGGRTMGGAVIGGSCNTNLAALDERTNRPSSPLPETIETFTERSFLIGFPTARIDPENPDNFVVRAEVPGAPSSDFPEIVFNAFPDGLCTAGCGAPGDVCNEARPFDGATVTLPCGRCSAATGANGGELEELGTSLGDVIVNPRGLSIFGAYINPDLAGICRQPCEPTTEGNGGCRPGYTCDPRSYTCVIACVNDAQCQWRAERDLESGWVAYIPEGSTAFCNNATGRCDNAEGLEIGSTCESDFDCGPNGYGQCIDNICYETAAFDEDGDGVRPHECPTGSVPVDFGDNGGGLCMTVCNSGADCVEGQTCLALVNNAVCIDNNQAPCETSADCGGDFICTDVGGGNSLCLPFCGADADCDDGQQCEPVEGTSFSLCEDLGQLCDDANDCLTGEQCFVQGNDVFGRCIPSCSSNADCEEGELCRIPDTPEPQPGEDPPAPFITGVCRALGTACSRSPFGSDAEGDPLPILPLRGDAQCAPGEECESDVPDELSNCVPIEDEETDAGTMSTPDAGPPADGG